MSSPTALGGVGAGATAAGSIVGAIGALTQGQSQANMYNYQAGVAKINATLAQQDAAYAENAGEVEAEQQGLKGRDIVGKSRVAFGAGNIDPTTGSASKVISSETAITQENEGVTRANAAKTAYGFNVKGAEDTAQAGVFQAAATTSIEASDITAASTILGGVGSVSSKWLQGSSTGMFSSLGGGSGGGGSAPGYGGGPYGGAYG